MIDSEGLGGRPSAWPISIISGVANRQGECHHRKASGERRGDGGRASAACRKATASPGAEVCDTARPSHHQCGVHALGAGDQQRVCKLGDFAARLPLARHRAGCHQYARHQHGNSSTATGTQRDGLGHGYERPNDLAIHQHCADGPDLVEQRIRLTPRGTSQGTLGRHAGDHFGFDIGRKSSRHRKPRRVRRAGARGSGAWHRQGHSLRCDVCDDPGLGQLHNLRK